jgi:hypothetical protein
MTMPYGSELNPDRIPMPGDGTPVRAAARSLVGRILVHAGFLVIAAVAFAAFEHFKVNGQSTRSMASLAAAAGFGLAPVRALVRELLAVEGRMLHLVHGIGGLALGGLALSGAIPGGAVLTHASLAPFAIMGAAQALMHSDHPRNPEQAAALRRFVTSLPEVEQFAKSDSLNSPDNVRRAAAVLSDLVAKAQALGQTELKSDPGFQSALQRVTTRFGLSLGLDAVDRAIGQLSANPVAAGAVRGLRRQLAAARRTVDGR